jgi:hypothetical protein
MCQQDIHVRNGVHAELYLELIYICYQLHIAAIYVYFDVAFTYYFSRKNLFSFNTIHMEIDALYCNACPVTIEHHALHKCRRSGRGVAANQHMSLQSPCSIQNQST